MPLGGLATAGLIIGGAGVLGQGAMGIIDKIKAGKKLKQAQSFFEKNKYEIPETAQAALDVAERQAQSLRLPGQDIMEAQVQQATASGVGAAKEAATSSSDVLAMLAGLYGTEQQRMQDIGISAAQNYTANQRNLQQALGTMAGYEDQRWQYNVLYPYQQMLGQAQAYGDRGAQELSGAFGGLMSIAGSMTQLGAAQKSFDAGQNQRFGQGGTFNPTIAPQPVLPPFSTSRVNYYPNMWNQTKPY